MERVATDVAKPPVASGELPSFEELLAKGSFHARLAQARLKRERALAESGDADGFILDTTRKPWEREAERAERRDPLTTALGNSIAVEGAAPAPTPAPSPAAARRGMGTAARPAARPGGGGLSAKIVPIRQGNVLWLDYPVAAEDRAAAVAALLPRHDDLVPDRVPPAVAPTVAPAIQPDQVAPAVAPAIEPVPAARRAAMVGGGFLSGLMIGAAVMMALPYHGDVVAPVPVAMPVPVAVAVPSASAVAPDIGAAALASAPLAAPDAAGDALPGVPAPIAGLSTAPLPAQGLASTDTPDAAPALVRVPGGPDVLARLDRAAGLALPGAATGPGSLPRPDGQPAVAGAVVLAAAAPGDAPLRPQENPPAVAPTPTGPVIVNAPESVTEAELAGLVERLGAAGFALAEPNRVDIPISESNVRFFHSEDAAAAQAVATRLGARLRDFTSFAPSPPAGTIEVWLSGRGNAAAPAKTRRASGQRAMTAEERELNLLRDRILQQLRNGEHL